LKKKHQENKEENKEEIGEIVSVGNKKWGK